MKAPLSWLKDYVEISDKPEGLAYHLTMTGLEVEGIEYLDDDVVFDINITPNRPDCLSILGIAREISAIYGKPLSFPEHNFVAETGELDFNIDILDDELCHRYAGRIIRGVNIEPSPQWLQQRLIKCGIRAINNVVDITNYVLLELGHPMHAFDLNKIQGKRIIVATAGKVRKDENPVSIKLLDGSQRVLDDDMLLINDASHPIALAGIMGGEDSEVTTETKDLLIESAWFLPSSIRKTSNKLGIKTESSYRFERGADKKILKKALDRATYLIHQIAGGKIYGKIDIYPKRHKESEIKISFKAINRYIGMTIPKKDVIKILINLGLGIETSGDEITVKPPSSRRDIIRDVDVIEEVVRLYGYEKVPSVVPKSPIYIKKDTSDGFKTRLKRIKDIRYLLKGYGFTEVINYSFMGEDEINNLDIKDDDTRRHTISILNPIRQEDKYLRTTITTSLIRNLVHNYSYGNRDLRLFEIGKVFINERQDNGLPKEPQHIGLLLTKEGEKQLYRDSSEEFYILKGVVENILDDLCVKSVGFVRSNEPFLHQGKASDIIVKFCSGEQTPTTPQEESLKIGYLGVLSARTIERLPVKILKQDVLIAELYLDTILDIMVKELPIFKTLPQYPYIERDVAILIDNSIEVARLFEILRSYESPIIENIRLFDVYKGKGIADDKKSVAFNIRYRSNEKTLSDSEIETLHNDFVNFILSRTGGILRG
ncbi:MAG: phenylalanine--tRNA ligase subunit beta [Thermodesulfovibrionales bacterium]|nr:phenylalanine--tRNA ligase subunit beta [Thermodesulfovibrionales bacterium]